MSEIAEQLRDQIVALPETDRAELVRALIDSLEPSEEEQRKAWRAELIRRIDEIESGKDKGIPAEEVFAEAREKYGWK